MTNPVILNEALGPDARKVLTSWIHETDHSRLPPIYGILSSGDPNFDRTLHRPVETVPCSVSDLHRFFDYLPGGNPKQEDLSVPFGDVFTRTNPFAIKVGLPSWAGYSLKWLRQTPAGLCAEVKEIALELRISIDRLQEIPCQLEQIRGAVHPLQLSAEQSRARELLWNELASLAHPIYCALRARGYTHRDLTR